MLRSLRTAIAPMAVMVALLPLTATASGMSLGVSHATLHARIEISFSFKVDCPMPAVGDSVAFESWDVSVEQAAGTGIASGSSADDAQSPGPLPFQCTSLNVRFPLDILADTSGRPFHKGPAIVTALLYVGYASGLQLSATYGPAVVRLAG
jgi:hypothetical protein